VEISLPLDEEERINYNEEIEIQSIEQNIDDIP